MIFIKKIIHTAIRQIGKTFRLTQHIPGHHNRDKRLPIHTTNSNAIRIVVNNLYGHSSESNHYLPPFASSLIMHVLTNAEKLIPRRDAASLAESRKLAGIRIVTGTTSPFTRYERISVSPASCSIRSEYVIAFYTFKLQYKCNNSTPAWEQRKLGELALTYSGGTPSAGNSAYYGGEIPFIRSAEIDCDSTELSLTVAGLNNSSAKLVDKGMVLYAMYGATSGEVAISKIKGAINQAILAMDASDMAANRFIAYWLRRQKKSITETFLQGGQGNLSGAIIKELGIPQPSLDEQRQIGSFFSNLDDLITLHQRKRLSIRQRSPVWS